MTYEALLQIFESLRLGWLDLLIPLAVFGLVYLAHYVGLADTGDRKRIAGALGALALASLRTAALGVFGDTGFGEVVEIVIVSAGSWLTAALLHEVKEAVLG